MSKRLLVHQPISLAALVALMALLTLQPLVHLASEPGPRVASGIGHLPLSFVPNAGQTDGQVRFQVRSLGGTLFFTPAEVVLSLPTPSPAQIQPIETALHPGTFPLPDSQGGGQGVGTSTILHLRFADANPTPEIVAGEALPGRVNYFIGNDPAHWRTGVPTYAGMVYRELYPGINLAYDGTEGLLKGTYTIAAGVDPSIIGWRYDGAEHVTIDAATGDLRIALPGGNVLVEQRPTAWQEIGGVRVPVDAAYTLADDGRVGFALGDYDPAYVLTIDPTIVYSTYLGGTGDDYGKDIAIDSAGNIYVIGTTFSTNFPLMNPLQATYSGGFGDIFVTKLTSTGSLVYSTYLGGTSDEEGQGISVDTAGNAYISGITFSTNFPTMNPLQPANGGNSDAFVAKLNSSGSALVYSSYLGGTLHDSAEEIAIDSAQNAYLTGRTQSANFPMVNALHAVHGGGTDDGYVAKLNADGTALVYSTYLGGSGEDFGSGIAADNAGNAYITGRTGSVNFPTANAFQTTGTVFVAKLNPTGSAFVYSTKFGGSNSDTGLGIAADDDGNAYVVGATNSNDFPTVNPIQEMLAGDYDVFVTKFNPGGTALIYSTYLGGTVGDEAESVAVDTAGNAYIVGLTLSTNYPTQDAIQPSFGGVQDAFVSGLNASGSALRYSTYLGGTSYEEGWGIAVDSFGTAYVIGRTMSTDFPTANAFQNALAGGQDIFITEITPNFVVNTTLDTDDGTCDTAHCSLREAIIAANAAPGTDTIAFDIAGAVPHMIALNTPLPLITDPVIIDGTTQAGYAGTPIVVLDGSALGVGVGTTCLLGSPELTGLVITAGNSTVRGLAINGFAYGAVGLLGGSGSVIEGNYIGTDTSGTIAVPNCYGVIITESADNRIGGTTPEARNIIAGNDDDGINIFGASATNNVIQGNYIGTDVTGLVAMGNAETGIKIEQSTGTLIGGTTPAERNIISANTLQGVLIRSANGNTVQGNYIGTDRNGNNDLGNQLSGISVESGSNNSIGGTAAGAGNVIANNLRGIEVVLIGTPATGNAILGNSIHSNDELGIDLGGDQVTANDSNDSDNGPNNLQNFPVIDTATVSAGSVTIDGTLNSVPSTQYRLEFFADSACDPSGNGEGRVYIGTTDVTTDGSGNATFSTTPAASLSAGNVITATATDPNNNTSEFSACEAAVAPPSADLSVTQTDAPDPVVFGTNLVYTITVTNNGPLTATSVILTDDLPDSTLFVSAIPSQGNCTQGGGIVTCDLGNLDSGLNVTVTVAVYPMAGGILSNVVNVSSSVADPNTANNTHTETTFAPSTPTATSTSLDTQTPTNTYTPSNTPSPYTPPPTLTRTPLPAPPPALTATPYTPTDTPTSTPLPTDTPLPTWSPTPTNTPPVSPTVTSTPIPSPPPM